MKSHSILVAHSTFLSPIFLLLSVLVWTGGLLFFCLLLHEAALGCRTVSWISSAQHMSVIVALRPRRPHSRGDRLDLSLSGLRSCPRTAGRPERYNKLGFTSCHLPPYCDDTNRAVRLRGWLRRRVAFRCEGDLVFAFPL